MIELVVYPVLLHAMKIVLQAQYRINSMGHAIGHVSVAVLRGREQASKGTQGGLCQQLVKTFPLRVLWLRPPLIPYPI